MSNQLKLEELCIRNQNLQQIILNLNEQGVCWGPNLVQERYCNDLEKYLLHYLPKGTSNLAHIHKPDNRWMYPLLLTPFLFRHLLRIIKKLYPIINNIVGKDPRLVELCGVMTMPGAEEQDFHRDTAYPESDSKWANLYSFFIPLTDITEIGGPTILHLGSHNKPNQKTAIVSKEVKMAVPKGSFYVFNSKIFPIRPE